MKAGNPIQSVSNRMARAGTLVTALLALLCGQLPLRADEPGHNHGTTSLAKALQPAFSADGLPAKLPRLPKGNALLDAALCAQLSSLAAQPASGHVRLYECAPPLVAIADE
jgi:hypothetical protein